MKKHIRLSKDRNTYKNKNYYNKNLNNKNKNKKDVKQRDLARSSVRKAKTIGPSPSFDFSRSQYQYGCKTKQKSIVLFWPYPP
jgi:hypothetical protein